MCECNDKKVLRIDEKGIPVYLSRTDLHGLNAHIGQCGNRDELRIIDRNGRLIYLRP